MISDFAFDNLRAISLHAISFFDSDAGKLGGESEAVGRESIVDE